MPSGRGAGDRAEVLSTGRLRVTTWLPSDYADLCALHSDPLVMRHMRSGVESADETRARLDRLLREQAELGWTKWRAWRTPTVAWSAAPAATSGFTLVDEVRRPACRRPGTS